MSFNTGTLLSAEGCSARMVANKIGSAAFLAPEITTSPFKVAPPEPEIVAFLTTIQVG